MAAASLARVLPAATPHSAVTAVPAGHCAGAGVRRQLTSALGMLSTLAGHLQVMPDQTFDRLDLWALHQPAHGTGHIAPPLPSIQKDRPLD